MRKLGLGLTALGTVTALWSLLAAAPVHARDGKHPFAGRGHDSMDLVVSLDWDPNDGKTVWTKQRLTKAFELFAEKAAGLTDGRVRICNLYVFPKNEQAKVADMRIEQTPAGIVPERAHAGLAGIDYGTEKMQVYTAYYTQAGLSAGKEHPEETLAQVMTHELGHYAFAVRDEYRETDPLKANRPDPGKPRATDVALVTIMGMPYNADALSAPGDYAKPIDGKDPKEHTAHFRAWGMSAWELITMAEGQLPLKAKLAAGDRRPKWGSLIETPIPESPVGYAGPDWNKCLGIHFMEGKSVSLVFDNSGSTVETVDAQGKSTLDYEKQHAAAFIQSMKKGDRLQIWLLDGDTPLFSMTAIESDAAGDPAKQAAIAALQAITKDNGISTYAADYGKPFTQALEVIAGEAGRHTNYGARRYVLVITDAKENASTDKALADLKTHSVPVFTLAINATDMRHSEYMARVTGGTTWRDKYASGATLYAEIESILRTNETLGWVEFPNPKADAPGELSTEISDLDQEARFFGSWNVDGVGAFELRSPSGTVITKDQLPANVSYRDFGEGGHYVVTDPEPGSWTSTVTQSAVGAFPAAWQRVAVDSPLAVSVSASGDGYPMPVMVEARLVAPDPVLGARVSAELVVPDGSPAIEPPMLVDDGTGADAVAEDGVYTGVLPTAAEGLHTIRVRAENPDGTAYMLAGAGSNQDGEFEQHDPVALPAFRREATTEYQEQPIEPAPTSSATAASVAVNHDVVWGDLNAEAPALYYELVPYEDNHYYIMTGRLWSTDGARMVTHVKLVGPDGQTVIAESSDFEGQGNSWIHWRAPDRERYWIVVEHATGGSGRFALSVSNWDRRIESFGSSPAASEDGGGCSVAQQRGGEGWLAGSFLAALWLRRRSRRRRAA